MKGGIKFQSVEVPYPKKLYLACVWIRGKHILLSPMVEAYKSLKLAKYETANYISQLIKETNNDEHVIPNVILILKLSYLEGYPLNKKMWEPVDYEYTDNNVILDLLKAINKQDLYNIVITPEFIEEDSKERKFKYNLAFACLKNKGTEIEYLMRASTLFVNPETKSAGIYEIEDIFGYDLVNKKKIKNKTKNHLLN